MIYVVFDLDGVLIDSAACVRTAYQAAGCTPPENPLTFWSHRECCEHDDKPHTIEDIYRVKDATYRRILREEPIEWLPPMMVAYGIRSRWKKSEAYLGIYSAAAPGSIDIVKDRWGSAKWPFNFGVDGMAYTPHKMQAIARLYELGVDEGVYVDDRDEGIDLPPGWKFVHYTGQDVKEVELEIGLV